MRRPFALVFASLLVGAAPAPEPAAEPVYDIVIRGGRVLDGAGHPWITADVAIQDGRIAVVGVVAGKGRQEIDARGRYVSPGFVDTPLAQAHFDAFPDPARARAEAEGKQPPGRLCRPEEVAAVAVLLASDEATFMVGENVVIDGGVSIRMYE